MFLTISLKALSALTIQNFIQNSKINKISLYFSLKLMFPLIQNNIINFFKNHQWVSVCIIGIVIRVFLLYCTRCFVPHLNILEYSSNCFSLLMYNLPKMPVEQIIRHAQYH